MNDSFSNLVKNQISNFIKICLFHYLPDKIHLGMLNNVSHIEMEHTYVY